MRLFWDYFGVIWGPSDWIEFLFIFVASANGGYEAEMESKILERRHGMGAMWARQLGKILETFGNQWFGAFRV